MFHRVCQRGGAVLADHFRPMHHVRREPAVLDPLDHQGADRRLGFGAFFRIVFLRRGGTLQRQHGHGLRVCFVDVLLHGVLDLRGQIAGVAGVPYGVAGGDHRRGQLAQQADGVRTLVEKVLAADGLDLTGRSLADRHAQPVAFDQPPPLVGDRVGGFARVQRGVDRAGEILQLGPKRLAVRKVTQLMALEEVGGQLAHLPEEPQITLLRARPDFGTLEHLDQSDRF